VSLGKVVQPQTRWYYEKNSAGKMQFIPCLHPGRNRPLTYESSCSKRVTTDGALIFAKWPSHSCYIHI